MFNSYYIFTKSNKCALSVSRRAVIVNAGPLPNAYFIWDILPMGGTGIFALRHHATGMFVYLGNGINNAMVMGEFSPFDANYVLRSDVLDTQGYVAIKSSDGRLVFDVPGNANPGTGVILSEWKGSDHANQVWQMVPIEVYAPTRAEDALSR